MPDVTLQVQTSTRWAVAWVWFVAVVFHWTQLSRLIGRDRVNGWALHGMYRLCRYRVRIGAGRFSKWRRAYRTHPDGYHELALP
jgi:hypothetical protein